MSDLKVIEAEAVISMIKKDKFKTVSFIYDLNNNPNNYLVIYKNKLSHQQLGKDSFFEKLAQICDLEGLGYINWGNSDTSKVHKMNVKNALPKIDELIVDPREKKGVIKKDGWITFNKYNEPKIAREYREYAENKKKESFLDDIELDIDGTKQVTNPVFKTVDEHFDWSKCPLWKFHINRLANPKLNEAIDPDGNSVSSFDYFLKWTAHVLRCDQKVGVAMMLISETHGTGKGIFIENIPDYVLGSDYSTKVNNETFVKEHNAIIKGKRFLNYDESKVNGKEREKVEEKLKTLITENKNMVRAMGIDQEEEASYCNVFINANTGVPYKLSNGDRRHTVFKTSNVSQRIAVKKEFGYSEGEYIEKLLAERDEFLKQLFTFEFDWADVRFTPLSTKAKRRIISGTNTSFDLFCDYARVGKTKEIEGMLVGFFDDSKIDNILFQVEAGFLENNTLVEIFEMFRDSKGTMSKPQVKRFLDEKIGQDERLNYKKKEGGRGKISVRKLDEERFDEELFNIVAQDLKEAPTRNKKDLMPM